MNRTYALPEDELRGEIHRRIYLLVTRKGGGWQAAGAAFGIASGSLSAPLATALWAASRLVGPAGLGPALHLSSNVLFVLTVPLLAVGACFLDRLEKKSPAIPPPARPRPARPERPRRLSPRYPHHN